MPRAYAMKPSDGLGHSTHSLRIPRAVVLAICAVALLVVWDRASILKQFAFRYTDKDQVVYWSVAHEVSRGRFHEPRFYGQAYHHYLDGVLAAPLVGFGVRPSVALPVVSSTISILPYFLLAACALRRRLLFTAFLAVALPLLLPMEYASITSMPRGFTTGILFATLAASLTLSPMAARSSFAFGLLLLFSVSLVPSTAILSFPVGIYAWVKNVKNRSFYLWGGFGALVAVSLHLASNYFYALHPENVVFPDASYLSFSWSALTERLPRLADYWGPVSPTNPLGHWLVYVALALLFLTSLRFGAVGAATSVLIGSALLIVSLGIEHVGVGSLSVFYPFARMYLALPLFVLLAVLWLELARGPSLGSRPGALVIVVGCMALIAPFMARQIGLEKEIEEQLATRSKYGVVGRPVAMLEDGCLRVREIAEEGDAELVVFVGSLELWVYSCEVLSNEAVKTLLLKPVVGERRTWRLKEEAANNPRKVVLFGINQKSYEAGQLLGAKFGPPYFVHSSGVVVAELPEGWRLLEFLQEMGLKGARVAIRRLQLSSR